ncbi:MAG: acyltransferase [Bacteroidales bacterium]|nr:acyltransferase [Bacteroidales bacterium]
MIIINKFIKWLRKLAGIDDRSVLERAIDSGMKIGADCNIQSGVLLDISHAWLISIGDRVTLAPRVHILAHDASTKNTLGYTVIRKTTIGNNVFIGAGSIVLPGVKIGNDCIIGAGSIVTHSIPDGMVAAGNPCHVLCTYEDYMQKRKRQLQEGIKYESDYLISSITEEKKERMKQELENSIGYIV